MVGLDGLEPTTSVLSGPRSNHLSYRPALGASKADKQIIASWRRGSKGFCRVNLQGQQLPGGPGLAAGPFSLTTAAARLWFCITVSGFQ